MGTYLVPGVLALGGTGHPDVALVPGIKGGGWVRERHSTGGHWQPHQHRVVRAGRHRRHVGVGGTEAWQR